MHRNLNALQFITAFSAFAFPSHANFICADAVKLYKYRPGAIAAVIFENNEPHQKLQQLIKFSCGARRHVYKCVDMHSNLEFLSWKFHQ